MKVGWSISAMHPGWTARSGVEQGEALGVDSFWLADHLMGAFHPRLWPEVGLAQPGSDPDAWLDPFCLIASLGESSSIPFGLCVTDSIRRGAADLARTAFTLQHICRGGFKLGIGSGEAMNLAPFDYPFDRPVGRTEELLRCLRELFDTGRYPGTVGRVAVPRESEAGRSEIWLAAHGPRMLRLTGQYADGWLPAFSASPTDYAERAAAIVGHAEAAGRATPELGFQPFTVLGRSREHVEELFEREPAAKLFALMFSAATWDRHGIEHPAGPDAKGFPDVIVHDLDAELLRDLAPRIPFSLLDEIWLIGSAEDIAGRLDPFAAAGCEHVVLANMTGIAGGVEEFLSCQPLFGELVDAVRGL